MTILQCYLIREGGSLIDMGRGKKYHFKPNAAGHHVCDVSHPAHLGQLLAIPEAYVIYDEKHPIEIDGDGNPIFPYGNPCGDDSSDSVEVDEGELDAGPSDEPEEEEEEATELTPPPEAESDELEEVDPGKAVKLLAHLQGLSVSELITEYGPKSHHGLPLNRGHRKDSIIDVIIEALT